MSVQATKWAWEQALQPKMKLALLAISDSCDEHGRGAMTVSKLAEMCVCEKFAMAHRLDLLQLTGLIDISVRKHAPGLDEIVVVLKMEK